MFFMKILTNEKFSTVKFFTNENSYMSGRSYILKKKLLVKKIIKKSAFIVHFFTNCNTNTKLF